MLKGTKQYITFYFENSTNHTCFENNHGIKCKRGRDKKFLLRSSRSLMVELYPLVWLIGSKNITPTEEIILFLKVLHRICSTILVQNIPHLVNLYTCEKNHKIFFCECLHVCVQVLRRQRSSWEHVNMSNFFFNQKYPLTNYIWCSLTLLERTYGQNRIWIG